MGQIPFSDHWLRVHRGSQRGGCAARLCALRALPVARGRLLNGTGGGESGDRAAERREEAVFD